MDVFFIAKCVVLMEKMNRKRAQKRKFNERQTNKFSGQMIIFVLEDETRKKIITIITNDAQQKFQYVVLLCLSHARICILIWPGVCVQCTICLQ